MAELAAHDGESTTPRKAQHKLGKVVNKIKLENFMESLEHLAEEEIPPTQDDLFGGSKAKDVALPRVRGSQRPGAHTRLLQSGPYRPRTSDPTERIRLRHETRLGRRTVLGARMSQMPSGQGRRHHHNHACTNFSMRWCTGQHA